MPAAQVWRTAATSLLPTVVVVVAVLTSMAVGLASPTEAGAVGCGGALLVVALAGRFNLTVLKTALYQSLRSTAMILFLVAGATLFTSVFISLGGGRVIQGFILEFASGTQSTLLTVFIMVLAIIIMGTIMDCIATVLILTPLYMPIVTALGLNPIWFGVLFGTALAMGHLTPPFAYSIFYLKTVAENVTTVNLYRGSIPFIFLYIIGLVLIYAFPQLSLWLPNLGGG